MKGKKVLPGLHIFWPRSIIFFEKIGPFCQENIFKRLMSLRQLHLCPHPTGPGLCLPNVNQRNMTQLDSGDFLRIIYMKRFKKVWQLFFPYICNPNAE